MNVETTTGRAAEGGHWYDRNGRPVYEMLGKNGKMRPVTLRDARVIGLVPGFSSIAAMEAKPALELWKINQALMSALTLPRLDGETDDAFMARAREDSNEQARKARDKGTAIHAAIECSFKGQSWDEELRPYVIPVCQYLQYCYECKPEDWELERSFAHPLGFGGKIDLSNRALKLVIDFKCKDFDKEKQPKDLAWPEHCMQLAAYGRGLQMPEATCINVFVSTRVPGLVYAHEWTAPEREEAWDAFQCLLKLWKLRRKYDPSFSAKEAA